MTCNHLPGRTQIDRFIHSPQGKPHYQRQPTRQSNAKLFSSCLLQTVILRAQKWSWHVPSNTSCIDVLHIMRVIAMSWTWKQRSNLSCDWPSIAWKTCPAVNAPNISFTPYCKLHYRYVWNMIRLGWNTILVVSYMFMVVLIRFIRH